MFRKLYSDLKAVVDERDLLALQVGLFVGVVDVVVLAAAIALQTPVPTVRPTSAPSTSRTSAPSASTFPSAEVAGTGGKAQ